MALQGKLPDDFPGLAALNGADITTFAGVRKVEDLTTIPGIGPFLAGQISKRMAELEAEKAPPPVSSTPTHPAESSTPVPEPLPEQPSTLTGDMSVPAASETGVTTAFKRRQFLQTRKSSPSQSHRCRQRSYTLR